MSGDRCLIVGGGITGCVSAMYLANLGLSVTLCEASSHLGGILRDKEINNECFYSNCQYLSVNESWFDLLPDSIVRELVCFEHRYGSVSELNGLKTISSNLAVPIFPKASFDLQDFNKKLDNSNLTSRLSFYPQTITSFLLSWARKYGINPDHVSGNNASALQIARVYLADQDCITTKLKNHADYDSVLALPFNKRLPNERMYAALPSQGYNKLFDLLENYLCELNVVVHKNTPVKVRSNESELSFLSKKTKLTSPEHLVWAANPNPLLTGLGHTKLDNHYGNAVTHYFSFKDSDLAIDPIYIQVFSDTKDINRIYLYNLGGRIKLTVECVPGQYTHSDVLHQTVQLLLDYGIDSNLCISTGWKWQSTSKAKLYIFYSELDRLKLENMMSDQKSSYCNIVDTGWLQYGRDAKINKILSQFSDIQGNLPSIERAA